MKTKASSLLAHCDSRRGPRATGPNPAKHNLQLARHQAQCRICRHPYREAIEQDFLDWGSPCELVQNYNLAGESALYRHAHALRLFERRRANLLGALDRIIERGGEVKPTAGAIVSAIRLSAQLQREAAAPPSPSAKGMVLSFEGMPESNAVRPRPNATSAPPPSRDPLRNVPSGAEGRGAAGPGQPPHAGAISGAPIPASATCPAPLGTQNAPGPAASGSSAAIATEQASQHPPAAAQAQSGPAPGQSAIGKESGPPQVAGFAWPRPPGNRKLSVRRARWCCTGQGPAP